MSNRYLTLDGTKDININYQLIPAGFDGVQEDMDTNKETMDDHIADADIHVTAEDKINWDGKADGITATELATHIADMVAHLTSAEHTKLTGIEDGAQVNQLAFSQVNGAAAGSTTDQFFIVGGLGITVSTNPTTKTVTITATGETAPAPHGSTHTEHGSDPIPNATETDGGLLSAADKTVLDSNAATLSAATSAATASALLKRDANGRAKIGAPSENDDIARKAEVDAVSAVVNGWRNYNDITELGLTAGTETMESICAAMADKSELRYIKVTSNTSTSYPASAGVLFVRKYADYRIELEFINGVSGGTVNVWHGYFDINIIPNFTGWADMSGRRSLTLSAGTYDNLDVNGVDVVQCITTSGDITINNLVAPATPYKRVRFLKVNAAGTLTFKYSSTLSMNLAGAKDLVLGPDNRYGFAELQANNASWFGNVNADWGTKYAGLSIANNFDQPLTSANQFYRGAGSPEGVVTAIVGAIYQRTDGSTTTTLYVKTSGTGNTGWTAK